METVNSLTTESAIRKIVMAGISIFSFWWFSKHGTNPDPGLMNIITETLLPALLTPIAVVVDTVWSYVRHRQADLLKKVAQLSPVILSDDQLKETVATVKELRSVAPDAPLGEVVAAANGIKETI